MSRRGAALAWPAFANAVRDGAAMSCGGASAAAAARGIAPAVTSTIARVRPHFSTAPPPAAADLPPASRPSPHFRPVACLPALRAQALASPPDADVRTRRRPATAAWAPPPALYSRCFSASLAPRAGAGADPGAGTGAGAGAGAGAATGAGAGPAPGGGEMRLSLGEALNQLVDAAIEKVEAGQLEEAVALLKDGLNTFEPIFPNSPELGELHNQAALLLLFQNKGDEAAYHAEVSLETTRRHFGGSSLLTAHRLLRLGVAKFVQGKMADAAGLLREAHDLLGGSGGPSTTGTTGGAAADPGSRSEAGFYLDCVALAHVKDAGGVAALTGSIRGNVRGIKEAYGADSMILSLALAQHSRLVNGGLESAGFSVGEVLLQQHISLLSEVSGPDGEDVAVARYKLATYYYTHDMLPDAGTSVRQAAVSMRAHYPDDHDMLVLCKHRLGMVCAAQGDHRAATQLLQASHKHFSGEGGQNMLAKEAEIGLAMAKFRAADGTRESSAQLQQEALELMRKEIEALAEAIGHGHMLVQGATRYYGQLLKLAR